MCLFVCWFTVCIYFVFNGCLCTCVLYSTQSHAHIEGSVQLGTPPLADSLLRLLSTLSQWMLKTQMNIGKAFTACLTRKCQISLTLKSALEI